MEVRLSGDVPGGVPSAARVLVTLFVLLALGLLSDRLASLRSPELVASLRRRALRKPGGAAIQARAV